MTTPRVTAIVSTYAAERFMAGCMDDLVAQTIFPDIEVIVIDSGSPQGEGVICARYVAKYPNIRYLRTEREPLYVAWNRAIGMARGAYLTSANTDDRHAPDAFERLAGALDSSPEAALVYADQYISHTKNETHAACAARDARLRRWPDFTHEDLMLRCITGSQPMWRRSAHEVHGLFDTSYAIAADYDLWLRFACTMPMKKVPGTLGVLYDSPHTMSGSANRWPLDCELLRIKDAHLARGPWRDVRGMRSRVAKALLSTGYWYVEHASDASKAAPFLRAAWRLDPFNFSLAKTYLLRGVLQLPLRQHP